MNERKQLIKKLAMMERRLVFHQSMEKAHKRYLKKTMDAHKSILIFMLLPAFFIGWQLAKKVRLFQIIKTFLQFGVVQLFTQAERKFVGWVWSHA